MARPGGEARSFEFNGCGGGGGPEGGRPNSGRLHKSEVMKLRMNQSARLRLALLIVLSAAGTSAVAYGVIRAWKSGSVELQPLVTVVEKTNFEMKIPAAGELQAVDSV